MRFTSARRRFLQSTLGTSLVLGIDALAPRCLLRAAEQVQGSQTGNSPGERILVVIQLSGGNDGLNTVIPIDDEEYYRRRPKIAIPKTDAISVGNQLAFHPSLREVASLVEGGLASVVHGVGYENPNRSHFESMDIWHSCHTNDSKRSTGWLGRYLDVDAQAKNAMDAARRDVPGLHLGNKQQPLALSAADVRVPSVRSLDEFRLRSNRGVAFEDLIAKLSRASSSEESVQANDLLDFVQASTSSALVASRQVNEARKSYVASKEYPDSRLGEQLSVVAQLIDAELETRIYYLELDGFDTHAQQSDTHAVLLREWSDAVGAFVRDLGDHGHGDRVCVMTFSEFGRRVEENASGGTDHGAAAPMILAGGGINTSRIGDQPSLTDLHDGDLRHAIDFRQVYATVLRDWLLTEPAPIVGRDYTSLPLFTQRA